MAFSVQTVEKRRYIFFQERGRDWERAKGQYICSANASHLAVPHLLRCGFPNWNPVGIHFRRGKRRHFMPMERTVYTYRESRQNPDFDEQGVDFSTP